MAPAARRRTVMIKLYDYLPSQNGWKVRQLLAMLDVPYDTITVSIFEGEGQRPDHLERNPWGAVPAIETKDGWRLAESNAILWHLSAGSSYRPNDERDAAKVLQWMSFEADYVQMSMGTLRYWTLTDKVARRPDAVVAGKRATAEKALRTLDRHLAKSDFMVGSSPTIADISVFAYGHLAADAEIATEEYEAFNRWKDRVRAQCGPLAEVHPYSIDPNSSGELP
jgi:glutathione S-transferase